MCAVWLCDSLDHKLLGTRMYTSRLSRPFRYVDVGDIDKGELDFSLHRDKGVSGVMGSIA